MVDRPFDVRREFGFAICKGRAPKAKRDPRAPVVTAVTQARRAWRLDVCSWVTFKKAEHFKKPDGKRGLRYLDARQLVRTKDAPSLKQALRASGIRKVRRCWVQA